MKRFFYRSREQILRGELRASRSLQVARGTSRFALVASCAGNFALRARCKSRIARIYELLQFFDFCFREAGRFRYHFKTHLHIR